MVTDQQLFLVIGIPTVMVLAGILVNVGCFMALFARIEAVQKRLNGRFDRLDAIFDPLLKSN